MTMQDTSNREIITTRLIDAPRAQVWKAWTTPEHLAQWWGPDGFSLTTKSFEFKEGGDWIFIMHGPDDRDYANNIHFTKIIEGERMNHDHGGDDGKVHFKAEITFTDKDGKTEVTMRSIFPSVEDRELVVKEHNAIEGAKQTIARLDEYVLSL